MFGVDELHDQWLYDQHMEKLEREEEEEKAAQARVDRLKTAVNPRGLCLMSHVLEVTGEPLSKPNQFEGWLRALTGPKSEEATTLFDSAIEFVVRQHPLLQPKKSSPPGCAEWEPEAKRARLVAAVNMCAAASPCKTY